MINSELLRDTIKRTGRKNKYIAESIGISENSLRNKINCKTEFTASEIVELTKILKLSRKDVSDIFLTSKFEDNKQKEI